MIMNAASDDYVANSHDTRWAFNRISEGRHVLDTNLLIWDRYYYNANTTTRRDYLGGHLSFIFSEYIEWFLDLMEYTRWMEPLPQYLKDLYNLEVLSCQI